MPFIPKTSGLDLTETTPVDPQTRDFNLWKLIPLRDRIRFARRSREHPDAAFGAAYFNELKTSIGDGTFTRSGRMSAYREGQVYLYEANEPAFDDNGLIMAGADEQYLPNPRTASDFIVDNLGNITTDYGITPWGEPESRLLYPGTGQASGQIRLRHDFSNAPDGIVYFEFFVRMKGYKYPQAILSVTNKAGQNRRIWFDLKKGIVGSKEGTATTGVKGSMTRFYSRDYELDAWFGQPPEWWLIRMEVDLSTGATEPDLYLSCGDRDGELAPLEWDDSGDHGIEYCGANVRDTRGTFMDYQGVRGACRLTVPAPYTQLTEGGFMVTVAPPVNWTYGDSQPAGIIAPILTADSGDRSNLLAWQQSANRFGSWATSGSVFATGNDFGSEFLAPFRLGIRFSATNLGPTTDRTGSEPGIQIIQDGKHRQSISSFTGFDNDGTLYIGSANTSDIFEAFTVSEVHYWPEAPTEAEMLEWTKLGERFFVSDNAAGGGDGSITAPWTYAELDNGTIWRSEVTSVSGAKSVHLAPIETEVTAGLNTGYAGVVSIRASGADGALLSVCGGNQYKPTLLDQSGTAAGNQLNKTLYTLSGINYIEMRDFNASGAYSTAGDGAQIRLEETGVGNRWLRLRACGDPLQNDIATPANTTNSFQGMYATAQRDFVGSDLVIFDQSVKGLVVPAGSTPADHQNIEVSHFYVAGCYRFGIQPGGSNGDYNAPFVDIHHFGVYNCGMVGSSEAADGVIIRDWTAYDISSTTGTDPRGVSIPNYGFEVRGSTREGIEIYNFEIQDLYKEVSSSEASSAWFNLDGNTLGSNQLTDIHIYNGQVLQTVGTRVAGLRAITPNIPNGQDRIYMDNMLFIWDTVSAAPQRGAYIIDCNTDGRIRNCTFIGPYESVRFATNGKANWSLIANLLGGTSKCVAEIDTSSAADTELVGNYYWRDGGAGTNLVTLEGVTYTAADIETVDANAVTGGTPAYNDVAGDHLPDRDYTQTGASPALGIGFIYGADLDDLAPIITDQPDPENVGT